MNTDANTPATHKPVLHVYGDKSVYEDQFGNVFCYDEGRQSEEARIRWNHIRKALDDGYLERLIEECKDLKAVSSKLDEAQIKVLEELVDSVTSEVGRAVVGLALMQLLVKVLSPSQSIRLHKGSSAAGFSWKEGISMRSLDKDFITPVLRRYDLLRLNADGIMMTRTLAENYPYSVLYKAAIRGAKRQWLTVVDWLEAGSLDAAHALRHLIGLLLNRTARFQSEANLLTAGVDTYLGYQPQHADVLRLIRGFIEKSGYAARIFEIAIHSFFQSLDEQHLLTGHLRPLSQMRSANKKHGNIGDVEITRTDMASLDIIEAWDAKYGKTYLREELEELSEKLFDHPGTEIAGFITDAEPDLSEEITNRITEISDLHAVKIEIVSFGVWTERQMAAYGCDRDATVRLWLRLLADSISQKRRHVAPIDEPTSAWVNALRNALARN